MAPEKAEEKERERKKKRVIAADTFSAAACLWKKNRNVKNCLRQSRSAPLLHLRDQTSCSRCLTHCHLFSSSSASFFWRGHNLKAQHPTSELAMSPSLILIAGVAARFHPREGGRSEERGWVGGGLGVEWSPGNFFF